MSELQFRHELEQIINRCSMENGSNTPDFILCEYIIDSLNAFDRAVKAREQWYGRKKQPPPFVQQPPAEPGKEE